MIWNLAGHVWAANAVLLLVFWYLTGVPELGVASLVSLFTAGLLWRMA